MAGTFSESWYRVANVRVALRPSVTFRKQRYQGDDWYVLSDPYTGSYYRLSPAYYGFVAQFDFNHSIEELWFKALEENPSGAPGQHDVITLLSELSGANLVFFEDANDSSKMFERQWKKDRQKKRKQVMNFLFIRFSLGNPNRWLERGERLWKLLYNKVGALIWFIVVLWGIKTAIEHSSQFAEAGSNVLSPNNMFLLYVGMAFIKTFHEWGHASMCKRFGGDVNAWGLMFVLFTPLPFVDTTSAWVLRNKWQRVLVGSAGMIIELFLGAIACFIWAASPPGLVHGLAFNMMFTASVSTLLFNANPLMRFDGYYIFSDIIEIPNLQQKSKDQIHRLGEKYVFGMRNVELPARTRRESLWLTGYGIGAMIYRVFLLVGIVLFIADSYFILGMVLASVMAVMWIFIPFVKFMKYVVTSPKLRQVRLRAVGIVYGGLVCFLLFLSSIKFPYSIEATGIVEAPNKLDLTTQSSARVLDISGQVNKLVHKGDVLLRMENPTLELELAKIESRLRQSEVMKQQVLSKGGLEKEPVEKQFQSLLRLKEMLLEQKKALTVTSPKTGVWLFPNGENLKGQWIPQGHNIGHLVSQKNLRFTGVISQEDASDLFNTPLEEGKIRLVGQGDTTLSVTQIQLLPHAQEKLPSNALGWKGGGPIAVQDNDETGMKAKEPFYLVFASFDNPALVYPGQMGCIKINLPEMAIGARIVRYVQQFLQQRYQL